MIVSKFDVAIFLVWATRGVFTPGGGNSDLAHVVGDLLSDMINFLCSCFGAFFDFLLDVPLLVIKNVANDHDWQANACITVSTVPQVTSHNLNLFPLTLIVLCLSLLDPRADFPGGGDLTREVVDLFDVERGLAKLNDGRV